MDITFNITVHGLSSDKLNELKSKSAAVKCGKRKKVHYSEIHAYDDRKVNKLIYAAACRVRKHLRDNA